MPQERWAFSTKELNNPSQCHSFDDLIANLPQWEIGIIVYRNGQVSNRWADGGFGVPAGVADEANEQETLYHPESGEETHTWADVEVDEAGNFLRFVKQPNKKWAW